MSLFLRSVFDYSLSGPVCGRRSDAQTAGTIACINRKQSSKARGGGVVYGIHNRRRTAAVQSPFFIRKPCTLPNTDEKRRRLREARTVVVLTTACGGWTGYVGHLTAVLHR